MKKEKTIYLDNASTTPVFPQIQEVLCSAMENYYGNPSSLHSLGLKSEKLIHDARNKILSILRCKNHSLYFTSGATESNNWAIQHAWNAKSSKGKLLAASESAHPSILEKLKSMKSSGGKVVLIPVKNNGIIDISSLKNSLNKDAIFISILLVNNETGAIQPIHELVSAIRELSPNCLIHIDAVQAFCKLPYNFITDDIDLISISAHKIGGPKGTGALIAKNNIKLSPLLYGGGQESGLRGGTENVLGIYGFGLAASLLNEINNKSFQEIKDLRNKFEDYISSNIPDSIINSKTAERSPYITNISFKGVLGEVLVHALEEENIYISTGSACSSRKDIFSHVLKAMDVPLPFLKGSVRLSFFPGITQEDILKAAAAIQKAVFRIRNLS